MPDFIKGPRTNTAPKILINYFFKNWHNLHNSQYVYTIVQTKKSAVQAVG
uniref:Uncharacterized protein n=1 Tax=Anguilla anguilla TaxID=7936 RepID=A0A0E9T776_ANGAN